ncbi:class I SAM-dependent methyltransferase [Nonomuraea sp. NPDC050556]|uniref:class I SAM-dependent methyltransferase n=1 Tax=Nonomuraea sp. NPDC050556 TaxID=3364369 RepID=UPI0037A3D7A6
MNAEAYERCFALLTARTVDPLLNLVSKSRAQRLLDVGCGTGVVTGAALALGAEVTAVDADLGMLEHLARRHPHADVRLAALPELPFPDEAFDAVAGNFVINHVEDVPAALEELRRVLRPGGTLALSWWKSDEMHATGVIGEAMLAAGLPYERPVRAFAEPRVLAAALKEAGFSGAGVDTMRWRHHVDLDEWWNGVIAAGGPRFGALASLSEADAARVRSAYDLLASPYAEEGFPVAAHLAHATR